MENSLRRLQVEAIDLYQVHWPQPEPEIEEAWSTVAQFVKEGKVRYVGVSNFNVTQLQRIAPLHPIASLQPPYSMLVRGVEDEILPYCAQQNIGVVAYSPMQKGMLTGKFTRERLQSLAPDDHRRNDAQFKEPMLTANLQFVEALRPIAAKHGKTLAQLSLAWILRRPEVTAVIVGTRKPSQIDETSAAADFALVPEDLIRIDDLLKTRQAQLEGQPSGA